MGLLLSLLFFQLLMRDLNQFWHMQNLCIDLFAIECTVLKAAFGFIDYFLIAISGLEFEQNSYEVVDSEVHQQVFLIRDVFFQETKVE